MKRQRIITKRGYEDPKYYQSIEVEEYEGRQFLYLCDPDGMCPVCVEFVEGFFKEQGREYRLSGRERCVTYSDLYVGSLSTNSSILGPWATEEEWEVWCKQNKKLWEETDKWIKEYQKDPYKVLTKLIKGN